MSPADVMSSADWRTTAGRRSDGKRAEEQHGDDEPVSRELLLRVMVVGDADHELGRRWSGKRNADWNRVPKAPRRAAD